MKLSWPRSSQQAGVHTPQRTQSVSIVVLTVLMPRRTPQKKEKEERDIGLGANLEHCNLSVPSSSAFLTISNHVQSRI